MSIRLPNVLQKYDTTKGRISVVPRAGKGLFSPLQSDSDTSKKSICLWFSRNRAIIRFKNRQKPDSAFFCHPEFLGKCEWLLSLPKIRCYKFAQKFGRPKRFLIFSFRRRGFCRVLDRLSRPLPGPGHQLTPRSHIRVRTLFCGKIFWRFSLLGVTCVRRAGQKFFADSWGGVDS